MSHLGVGSAWWLVVLAATAWPAGHLADLGVVALVLPPVFGLGVLLVWRYPVAASLLVCSAQATSLLVGVSPLSPAGLVPGLAILVVLGLSTPPRLALPMVVLHLAVVVATGLALVRTLVGVGLFLATWLLADQVRRRREHLVRARERLDRLAARDATALADQEAAEERRRLVARSAGVVGAALTDVRRTATLAAADLDPRLIARTRERAVEAIDELRDLLGLVGGAPGSSGASRAPGPSGPGDEAGPTDVVGSRLVSRLRDLALALGLVAVGLVDLHLDELQHPPETYLLGSLLGGTLALRSRPVLAVAAATAVMAVALGLAVPMGHGVAESATLGLLTWTLASRARPLDLVCWVALLVTTAAVAQQRAAAYPEVVVALMGVVVLTAWARSRVLAEQAAVATRSAELTRAVDAVVRESLAEGRTRLARDLHDVVGHAVGVMVLQAGAAETLRERDPDRARAALADVAATGDEALQELVALDGDPVARMLPFAEEVESMVDRIRRAGLPVELRSQLELPPGPVAAALHRVVQESLTNAARHSPGAAVTLDLRQEATALVVTATNGPGTGPTSGPATGTGLLGLRTRLACVGGRLEAGGTPDGGFRLRASVPVLTAPSAPGRAATPIAATGRLR